MLKNVSITSKMMSLLMIACIFIPAQAYAERMHVEGTAEVSLAEWICRQKLDTLIATDLSARRAFQDICLNGWLMLDDLSVSQYQRGVDEVFHFYVNVTEGPAIQEETINVTAKVHDLTIPLIGRGNGVWSGELSTERLLPMLACDGNFDVEFKATATAKSEHHPEVSSERNINLRANKRLSGLGEALLVPSPTDELNNLVILDAAPEGYTEQELLFYNYYISDNFTVDNHSIYCYDGNLNLTPCGPTGDYRILKEHKISNPQPIGCGGNIPIRFECKPSANNALLIINARHERMEYQSFTYGIRCR